MPGRPVNSHAVPGCSWIEAPQANVVWIQNGIAAKKKTKAQTKENKAVQTGSFYVELAGGEEMVP